jgi:hypothetical protein
MRVSEIFLKTADSPAEMTPLAVARDFLQCADQDANFMKTAITCDESWVQDATWQQSYSHLNKRL